MHMVNAYAPPPSLEPSLALTLYSVVVVSGVPLYEIPHLPDCNIPPFRAEYYLLTYLTCPTVSPRQLPQPYGHAPA